MDGPPPRFRCPPEFEAVAGGVPLGEGPGTELWLIRAPADFCPQSLEGCPVPLNGLERLRPPPGGDNDSDKDKDNDPELLVLRGGPGGGDCPLLLSPVSPEGSLGCAPPLRGSLTITRSFGDPPAVTVTVTPPATKRRRKAKVTAEEGTVEGTVPPPPGTQPGEGPGPPQDTPVTPEVTPEVTPRKKKKKKKHKWEEQQ